MPRPRGSKNKSTIAREAAEAAASGGTDGADIQLSRTLCKGVGGRKGYPDSEVFWASCNDYADDFPVEYLTPDPQRPDVAAANWPRSLTSAFEAGARAAADDGRWNTTGNELQELNDGVYNVDSPFAHRKMFLTPTGFALSIGYMLQYWLRTPIDRPPFLNFRPGEKDMVPFFIDIDNMTFFLLEQDDQTGLYSYSLFDEFVDMLSDMVGVAVRSSSPASFQNREPWKYVAASLKVVPSNQANRGLEFFHTAKKAHLVFPALLCKSTADLSPFAENLVTVIRDTVDEVVLDTEDDTKRVREALRSVADNFDFLPYTSGQMGVVGSYSQVTVNGRGGCYWPYDLFSPKGSQVAIGLRSLDDQEDDVDAVDLHGRELIELHDIWTRGSLAPFLCLLVRRPDNLNVDLMLEAMMNVGSSTGGNLPHRNTVVLRELNRALLFTNAPPVRIVDQDNLKEIDSTMLVIQVLAEKFMPQFMLRADGRNAYRDEITQKGFLVNGGEFNGKCNFDMEEIRSFDKLLAYEAVCGVPGMSLKDKAHAVAAVCSMFFVTTKDPKYPMIEKTTETVNDGRYPSKRTSFQKLSLAECKARLNQPVTGTNNEGKMITTTFWDVIAGSQRYFCGVAYPEAESVGFFPEHARQQALLLRQPNPILNTYAKPSLNSHVDTALYKIGSEEAVRRAKVIRKVLFRYWCNDVAKDYHTLLLFLAYAYWVDEVALDYYLCVCGKGGTGKTSFFESYMKAFGRHGRPVTRLAELTGSFNTYATEECLLVVIDDVEMSPRLLEWFKGNVSREQIDVEGKNRDTQTQVNVSTKVLLQNSSKTPANEKSNSFEAARFGTTNRRELALVVHQQIPVEMFDRFQEAIQANGSLGMRQFIYELRDLIRLDWSSGEKPTLELTQPSLALCIKRPGNETLRFWYEWARSGKFPTEDLWRDYHDTNLEAHYTDGQPSAKKYFLVDLVARAFVDWMRKKVAAVRRHVTNQMLADRFLVETADLLDSRYSLPGQNIRLLTVFEGPSNDNLYTPEHARDKLIRDCPWIPSMHHSKEKGPVAAYSAVAVLPQRSDVRDIIQSFIGPNVDYDTLWNRSIDADFPRVAPLQPAEQSVGGVLSPVAAARGQQPVPTFDSLGNNATYKLAPPTTQPITYSLDEERQTFIGEDGASSSSGEPDTQPLDTQQASSGARRELFVSDDEPLTGIRLDEKPECILCGAELDDEGTDDFCLDCLQTYDFITCSSCGHDVPTPLMLDNGLCSDCGEKRTPRRSESKRPTKRARTDYIDQEAEESDS